VITTKHIAGTTKYKEKTTLYLVRVTGILVYFTIMISDDYKKFFKHNRYQINVLLELPKYGITQ